MSRSSHESSELDGGDGAGGASEEEDEDASLVESPTIVASQHDV